MYERELVLIAGLPGTGKSHVSQLIREHLGAFVEISIDPLKERIWDDVGFDSLAHKRETEAAALSEFFRLLERAMVRGERIIADYPFSEKQRGELGRLCVRYEYRPVTVRMVADLEILYERQRNRDLDESRHLGHIVNSYRKGDSCRDRSRAPGLLSHEEFIHRCTTRGYEKFSLGPVLELDTSDFSTVDFAAVLRWIGEQYASPHGGRPDGEEMQGGRGDEDRAP